MTVVFLLFLISILYCDGSFLPKRLKCIDILCKEKVSNARTFQYTTVQFGDLKELEKAVKVKIRGKNVNDKDFLWLVEFKGLTGFVNFSLLKEDGDYTKIDLTEVDNPYYTPSYKFTGDETENNDNETDTREVSKTADLIIGTNRSIVNDETESAESDDNNGNIVPENPSLKEVIRENPHTMTAETTENKNNKRTVTVMDETKENKEFEDNQRTVFDETQMPDNRISKEFVDKQHNATRGNATEEVKEENKESEEKDKETSTIENNESGKNTVFTENQQTVTGNKKDENAEESMDVQSPLMTKKVTNEVTGEDIAVAVDEESMDVQPALTAKKVTNGVTGEDIAVTVDEERTVSNKAEHSNPGSNDKDSLDSTEERIRSLRSPLLHLILKIETSLHEPIKMFLSTTGLHSSVYLTRFVNNWLSMSLESFVLIVSLFLAIVLVVFTPKLLRFNRDWQGEVEKQMQLIGEYQSQLRTMEEAREKLTIQNRNFEVVIDEYKERVTAIQEDASANNRRILTDLEVIRRTNENKMEKLAMDLEMKVEQCELLGNEIEEKKMVIEELRVERSRMEQSVLMERVQMEGAVNELKERLLEVDTLRERLGIVSEEKTNLKEELDNLCGAMRDTNDQFQRLHNCFEDLKMFEELGEEERREKVQECLESREVRQRLEDREEEVGKLKVRLQEAGARIGELEERSEHAEQLSAQYERQRSSAVKEYEAGEIKLKVLTDYFRGKEIEMQKCLGHESAEKGHSRDVTDTYRHRIDHLVAENESLSKTIQQLKTEVRESQKFAVKCKNEANSTTATSFVTISNLERELMREKDESKKLRCRLSYYIGPNPPRNTVTEGAQSRQSERNDNSNSVPAPPIFPLAMLPQMSANKVPFSGRNSASSNSKKSNHS